MNLNRVTITGADDFSDIPEMLELSKKYWFLEWGILVSKRQTGTSRFPTIKWINDFTAAVKDCRYPIKVSMHICGRWVREILLGTCDVRELPTCLDIAQRIQLNTHAQVHESTVRMLQALSLLDIPHYSKEFIFQADGVNEHLAQVALSGAFNTSLLFDKSGGAGILPDSWPLQVPHMRCGYAGGLGPDNVEAQIRKIESLATKPYWIDMEKKVRTSDDSKLDMDAVRTVLQASEKYATRTTADKDAEFRRTAGLS